MSYIKYLKENLNHYDVVYGDDIESEDGQKADQLAIDNDINILRDKELSTIIKSVDDGEVVWDLWTAWDNADEEFSFDVVTDVKHGGMGIGSKLVDMAISEYNSMSDAFENPIMRIKVISQIMEKILLKRKFEIEDSKNGMKIMVRK